MKRNAKVASYASLRRKWKGIKKTAEVKNSNRATNQIKVIKLNDEHALKILLVP